MPDLTFVLMFLFGAAYALIAVSVVNVIEDHRHLRHRWHRHSFAVRFLLAAVWPITAMWLFRNHG